MSLRKLFTNNTGDTIVEVLIAIAVASLVVGAAYTVSNRSLQNARQAQEHSEAYKIAETQIEQIRAIAATTPAGTGIFTTGTTGRCIAMKDDTVTGVTRGQLVNFTTGTVPSDASNYPAACKEFGSVNYRTGFTVATNGTGYVVRVFVNWDGIRGGQDNVSYSYGVYPQ